METEKVKKNLEDAINKWSANDEKGIVECEQNNLVDLHIYNNDLVEKTYLHFNGRDYYYRFETEMAKRWVREDRLKVNLLESNSTTTPYGIRCHIDIRFNEDVNNLEVFIPENYIYNL